MEQAITQLAVKILFDNSTGFDEIRWTIFYPADMSMTLIMISSEKLH